MEGLEKNYARGCPVGICKILKHFIFIAFLFVLADRAKEGNVDLLGHIGVPICVIVLLKVSSADWCQL